MKINEITKIEELDSNFFTHKLNHNNINKSRAEWTDRFSIPFQRQFFDAVDVVYVSRQLEFLKIENKFPVQYIESNIRDR